MRPDPIEGIEWAGIAALDYHGMAPAGCAAPGSAGILLFPRRAARAADRIRQAATVARPVDLLTLLSARAEVVRSNQSPDQQSKGNGIRPFVGRYRFGSAG